MPGIESDFLNDADSSGALSGLIGAAGTTISYVDATPTLAEFVAPLEQAACAECAGYDAAADPLIVVMHSRRLSWIRQNVAVGLAIPAQGCARAPRPPVAGVGP